jgi:hypothetical protein
LAKITLEDILAQFASQQGLNDRFQKIEDEFNNKVLYRDEAGAMAVDLDMNGNTILNAVFDSTEISGSAAQIVYTPGANTYLTGVELQDTSDQTDAELVIQAAADAALDSRLDALEITVPANTGRITATEIVADRADALSIVNEAELDTTTPLATSAIQSASSVTGTTGEAVFNQQVGTDLEFKKIKEGANMTITEVNGELILANTGSIVGDDAVNINFTPFGTVVATDVQAVIEEIAPIRAYLTSDSADQTGNTIPVVVPGLTVSVDKAGWWRYKVFCRVTAGSTEKILVAHSNTGAASNWSMATHAWNNTINSSPDSQNFMPAMVNHDYDAEGNAGLPGIYEAEGLMYSSSASWDITIALSQAVSGAQTTQFLIGSYAEAVYIGP